MADAAVYFDLEATGTDPYTDQIVEAYFQRVSDDQTVVRHWFVVPSIPIPTEATEVHGIDAERLAEEGAEPFREIADEVQALISDAVLVGYHSRSYDVPLLHTELKRAGRPGLPLDEYGAIDVPEVDLLKVWRAAEPRTLETAVSRFAPDEELDAHQADSDAAVLDAVLQGMSETFGLVGTDFLDLTAPDREVDRAGKFEQIDGDEIVFAFGKHKGDPVGRHRDYLRWMLGADFPPSTKAVIRQLLDD